MTNLKDLLDKIKNGSNKTDNNIAEPVNEESTIVTESDFTCTYLNENGTCSDGCSCSNIEIEQECPFYADASYQDCCCFESANYDDDVGDDEEFED